MDQVTWFCTKWDQVTWICKIAKCAFPEGAVRVAVKTGNSISAEAMATLPPRARGDFTGERAVWEGKFYIS